jgi:hypothetical protein
MRPQPCIADAVFCDAANGEFEPRADVTKSRCVRSQRVNLLRCREMFAAAQRQMQPFRRFEEMPKP